MQKLLLLLMVIACGALSPWSLADDEFQPQLIEKPLPKKNVNSYNSKDKVARNGGAWAPTPTWDAVRAYVQKTYSAPKVDFATRRATILSDAHLLTREVFAFDPENVYLGGVAACGGMAFAPFPMISGSSVGAARLDKGKMVLLPHDGIYDYAARYPTSNTAQFLKNILAWSAKDTPRVAVLDEGSPELLQKDLRAIRGYDATARCRFQNLSDYDVVLCRGTMHYSPQNIQRLETFVRGGGLLVVAETAWYFLGNPYTIQNYPIHKLTAQAGLWFTPAMPQLTRALRDDDVWFFSNTENFVAFYDTISAFSKDAIASLCALAEQSIAIMTDNPKIRDVIMNFAIQMPLPYMDKTHPFMKKKYPVQAVMARAQSEMLKALPPNKVPIHPCAKDWPGLVSIDATRISRTLDIPLETPSHGFGHNLSDWHTWRMTGLYAPAGQPITVRVPDSMVNQNIKIQIGCHVDVTFDYQDAWTRFPEVMRTATITRKETVITSAFGGIVTIAVPPGHPAGVGRIEIEGAVLAPYYVYGETSLDAWKNERSKAPGAWGYLESDKLIAFGKRKHLEKLTVPDSVCTHWYNVIALGDYVTALDSLRKRPEMVISDRQINVGYGHAGYPAMMCYDEDDIMVSPRLIHTGDWGFYHELGHGYQNAFRSKFSLANHAEIDVNIFPYIVHEKIHGNLHPLFLSPPHSTVDPAAILSDLEKQNATPEDLRVYEKLGNASYYFYWQLRAAFGWELFAAVNREIIQDPYNQKNPVTHAMNDKYRFMYLLCLKSQRNLIPYFKAYGFRDFSKEFRDAVKGLQAWSGNTPITAPKSQALSCREDVARGTLLTRVTGAASQEPGDTLFYRILSGNEDGAFRLNPYTGELYAMDVDFERKSHYNLCVEAFDADLIPQTASCTLSVKIVDVDEAPQLVPSVLPLIGSSAGVYVGKPVVRYQKGDSELLFQIVEGNDSGLFRINKRSSMIMLVKDVPENPPPFYELTLSVQSQKNLKHKTLGKVKILPGCQTGFLCRRWDTLNENLLTKMQPNEEVLLSRCSHMDATHPNSIHEYTTFFRAPHRGFYRFYVAGDDQATLYFSKDSNYENLRYIAQSPSWTHSEDFTRFPAQMSAPILLEEGSLYLIRAVQLNASGLGSCSVGVKWDNAIHVLEDNCFLPPQMPSPLKEE